MAQAGFKIRDQQQVHFITCTVVQWIDIFTRPVYAEIAIESLNFCIKKKKDMCSCLDIDVKSFTRCS
jgi:hypothetical protein